MNVLNSCGVTALVSTLSFRNNARASGICMARFTAELSWRRTHRRFLLQALMEARRAAARRGPLVRYVELIQRNTE
jgi:hypothetical protein